MAGAQAEAEDQPLFALDPDSAAAAREDEEDEEERGQREAMAAEQARAAIAAEEAQAVCSCCARPALAPCVRLPACRCLLCACCVEGRARFLAMCPACSQPMAVDRTTGLPTPALPATFTPVAGACRSP
jgi:hypothetical protein